MDFQWHHAQPGSMSLSLIWEHCWSGVAQAILMDYFWPTGLLFAIFAFTIFRPFHSYTIVSLEVARWFLDPHEYIRGVPDSFHLNRSLIVFGAYITSLLSLRGCRFFWRYVIKAMFAAAWNHPLIATGIITAFVGFTYAILGIITFLQWLHGNTYHLERYKWMAVGDEARIRNSQHYQDRAALLHNLGVRLGDRFPRAGAMADLDEAIHVAREAVTATPDNHPVRAALLNNLGNRLGDRFLRTGATADLDEAIRVAREAVKATPDDHPDRAQWLNSLGIRLSDRYSRTGAMADLKESIQVAQEAIKATPKEHPHWAALLHNLGVRLGDRFSRTGAIADLNEAIRIAWEAIEATPDDHPNRATLLNNLGIRLSDRYSRTGATADLDQAIRMAREAIEATPDDHPDRALLLNNLGGRLGKRFLRTGAMADLEEAIYITRKAVEATPGDHPDQAARLNNLGCLLGKRFLRTGAMADLEEAIYMAREAIKATPDDHPDQAARLNNLGCLLGDRYSRTGAIADLNEAIYMAREAVKATPDDHLDRAVLLNNLGNQLSDRFLRTGAMADLDEAIRIAREAIKATPDDHPNRATLLHNLGNRLGDRFLRTGAMADLDEAIRVAREAVKATPDDHPDRTKWLNSLGNRLSDRFSRTGAMADLDEAIRMAREAVKATPDDHSDRATLLHNLGIRLGDRFSRTGAMADLDEAIRVAREAVKATPDDHSDRATLLHSLGIRLGSRFSRTGAMADLEEAIRMAREAVVATPHDHPDRAKWLNSLGCRLSDRFFRTGAMADLDEATCVTREALNATSDDHPDRARWLNSLGILLGILGRFSRTTADLDEAIRVTRKAVKATPDNHPVRAGLLNNLGCLLGNRFSRTGAMADLDEAIRIAREAVDATPHDHPDRAGQLINLGRRLGDRFSCSEAMADLEEAKQCFNIALNEEKAPINTRITAGRRFLSSSGILQDQHKAFVVAETTIHLVPLSAPQSLQNTDKQHLLSQAVGLASDAAAIALHAGKGPVPAIELLETGRGVLASSLQGMRTDLSTLQQKHPELARSFVDLRDQLDAPTSRGVLDMAEDSPAHSASVEADRRHEASKQMLLLLKKIRSQPAFERFLLPPSEAEMREAAAQGPVVIVNVSSHRCDALIVEQSGIRMLKLPRLSRQDIHNRARDLHSLETLSWLWDAVVSPVLAALGFRKPPSGDCWPHMWWIPTGPLVRFPLHAAGHHFNPGSKTALDRVVSSYSSSIKTIIHARQQQSQAIVAESSQDVVLVTMQETPEQTRLRCACDETTAVQAVCKSMGLLYAQPRPYKKEVLEALEASRIFHFAGHGAAHPADPLQSLLLLKDWKQNPLTVASLLETNLNSKSPFLAYLSACGTGQIQDEGSIDESIHMTSAFQLAGFRHVVGTLWEVNDELCVDMARLTYEFLGKKGISDTSVSGGLHYATRTLRDQWVDNQKRTVEQSMPHWVPYVHYGA
ncbi:hypothetical protein ACJ41O_013877 [Fusarium nematophilum]